MLLTWYAVERKYQKQIVELEKKLDGRDREIKRLNGLSEMTIADLDLEKAQYLEIHQERLDDIQKRFGKEKTFEVEEAASENRLRQPNFQTVLDRIDKKYADEKRLVESEKERFLLKNRLARAKLRKEGKK